MKITIKLLGVITIGLIIYTFVSDWIWESSSSISKDMYSDSEELLNIINEEFLIYNTQDGVAEDKVNEIFDQIEAYRKLYQSEGDRKEEERVLFKDMGSIIKDYLLLIELNLTYENVPVDFDTNSAYSEYSSSKRNVYEKFFEGRKNLRTKYGFDYRH